MFNTTVVLPGVVCGGQGQGRGVGVGPAARRSSILPPRRQRGGERVHVAPPVRGRRGVGRSGARQGRQEVELAAAITTPELPHLLPARAHQVLVLRYPHLLAVDYACSFWSWSVPEIEQIVSY